MRKIVDFNLETSIDRYKSRLLQWASKFKHCCYLDSCDASSQQLNPLYSNYEFLLAVHASEELLITHTNDSLLKLKQFHQQYNDWIFGVLTYDIKNEIEFLFSNHLSVANFPLLHFFVPKLVFLFKKNTVSIAYLESYYSELEIQKLHHLITHYTNNNIKKKETAILFKPRITKENYIKKIQELKKHIQTGNIYEANFCQEFYTYEKQFSPLHAYLNLKRLSPTPFSVYYRFQNHYLLCASPERFLMKKGNKVISQPIKGTIKRGNTDKEDEKLKGQLFNDPKERAENIMIVDLVRNDLSKIAKRGSVTVEELCQIYSYPQVHQMISTIGAQVDSEIDFTEILKACFPMGSMTGAPKIRAMQLIEEYESTKRGLFSGSVGYITPEGDFDFNVVIRSLFYNADNNSLSFMVGSAITIKSDPEKEYEECLLKAKAMLAALDAKLETN